MKKVLIPILLLLLGAFGVAKAQSPANRVVSQSERTDLYDYYVYIKGVKTKDDVRAIEANVKKQKGVELFICNKFPVQYFLLKTPRLLSKEQFSAWVDAKKYTVDFFGQGETSKEYAVLAWRKDTGK